MADNTKYLDIKNDIAFKRVFGRDSSKAEAISLLNTFLRLGGDDKIKEIDFLNKEMIPEHFEGSRSIVDVRCKSESGKEFIIEMQNADNSIFIERSQVYGSKSMVDQFDSIRSKFRTLEQEKKEQAAKEKRDYKKPNWDGGYKSLAPTIVLMITSYNIFPNAPYLTNHKMTCEETQESVFQLIGLLRGKFSKIQAG